MAHSHIPGSLIRHKKCISGHTNFCSSHHKSKEVSVVLLAATGLAIQAQAKAHIISYRYRDKVWSQMQAPMMVIIEQPGRSASNCSGWWLSSSIISSYSQTHSQRQQTWDRQMANQDGDWIQRARASKLRYFPSVSVIELCTTDLFYTILSGLWYRGGTDRQDSLVPQLSTMLDFARRVTLCVLSECISTHTHTRNR